VPKLLNLEAKGEDLFRSNGCDDCHAMFDSRKGPSLYGIYGTPRKFTNGNVVIADQSYIRNSIVNPRSQIVQGYSNTMPTFAKMKEDDLWAIMAYVKSLSEPPRSDITLLKGGASQ
jgi:cytochrome c oxidase subunit 2